MIYLILNKMPCHKIGCPAYYNAWLDIHSLPACWPAGWMIRRSWYGVSLDLLVVVCLTCSSSMELVGCRVTFYKIRYANKYSASEGVPLGRSSVNWKKCFINVMLPLYCKPGGSTQKLLPVRIWMAYKKSPLLSTEFTHSSTTTRMILSLSHSLPQQ